MIGANEDLVQIDGLWPFCGCGRPRRRNQPLIKSDFREASPVEKGKSLCDDRELTVC